jgi:hypothetical protein
MPSGLRFARLVVVAIGAGRLAVSDDLAALAAEAYVYGFALVFDLQAVGHFTRDGMGSLAPAPANIFSHAKKLAGPDDRFVSINNDTIYSIAQVDVSGGPVQLRFRTRPDAITCCSSSMRGPITSPTWAAGRRAPGSGPSCWSRQDGRGTRLPEPR